MVEDVDHRQVVAFAHFIIVEVVGGRDLHAAGAELRVDIVVGNDGDVAIGEGQANGLADHVGL